MLINNEFFDKVELIANGENTGVEFKRDDIRSKQLYKEIVALANLKGGRVLLGIDDDKNIVGITRAKLSEWVVDTVLGRYVHPVMTFCAITATSTRGAWESG